MRSPIPLPPYSRAEEICNMVTHVVGGALGVAALVVTVFLILRKMLGHRARPDGDRRAQDGIPVIERGIQPAVFLITYEYRLLSDGRFSDHGVLHE